ncbi:LuxR C-terminal-related transcriptional regulator [Rhodococcoides kroppenstedtii]|uniref:LuxR C-terminal-related transcriptional regulator n=1 Tax=Rhodococcoides kroppenstedtii TaxID=293050 RepID=UPI00363A9C23
MTLDDAPAGATAVDVRDHSALTVLALRSVGLDPDPYLVSEIAALPIPDAVSAIERTADLTDVSSVLRGTVGPHGTTILLRRVTAGLLDAQILAPDTAVALATAGVRLPALADFLTRTAESATPEQAPALWDAAIAAGADPGRAAAPRARARLAAGDLDAAAQQADTVLTDPASDDEAVRGAARVAATVALRRGAPSHAASVYRWLGAARAGSDVAHAVVSLLAVGERETAETFSGAPSAALPTSDTARNALVADGMLASVSETPTAALGSMLRACALADPTTDDHPASLAGLLAIHLGDPRTARDVLTEASTTRTGLLGAWAAMLLGDVDAAETRIRRTEPDCLDRRDLLWWSGLRAAVARRRGDTGALASTLADARRLLVEVEPDLYTVLPVGELWLASTRLGDAGRIRHAVDRTSAILAGLGEPPLWATAWHWYGVQAAILAGAPADLVPHARTLGALAAYSPHAAAVAAAGRCWLRVLQGEPDADDVRACTRSLERFGHAWEAARLASDAALRVDDTRTATALLQTAREITSAATVPDALSSAGELTDREAEVAHLLVLGLTYREIGARLYISAKTVEHHVARIRRRLDAGSRSELLSMLRAAGYGQQEEREQP